MLFTLQVMKLIVDQISMSANHLPNKNQVHGMLIGLYNSSTKILVVTNAKIWLVKAGGM